MNPLQRLAARVSMALGIGRQTSDTDESQGTATLQAALPAGELRSDLPLVQQFGFCSRPIPGCDVIVAYQSGDRSKGVVIATGHQPSRPQDLQPGEVCVLHPPTGSRIWLQQDGSILLKPASGLVTLDGALMVTGTITAPEVVINGVAHSSHEHTNGNDGQDTGGPIAG